MKLLMVMLLEEKCVKCDGKIQVRLGLHHQEVCMLSSQVLHLHRELADTQVEHLRQLDIIRGQLTRLNQNFLRFANLPTITGSCPWQIFHHNAMEEEETPLHHDRQQPRLRGGAVSL